MNRPLRDHDLFTNPDQQAIELMSGSRDLVMIALGIALVHLRVARRVLQFAQALNGRGVSPAMQAVTRAVMIVEGLAPQLAELAQDEEE